MGGMLAQYGGVNDPYGSFTAGRTGTQGGLPREWMDFLSGAFGPLEPLVPAQLDEPLDTGRSIPRRWQYPVGWNLPVGIPGSEGLKLASFQALRRYPDMYSVLRACVDVRKEEMLGLDWDIGPTEEAMKQLRGQKGALAALADEIDEAKRFFMNPDPNYAGYQGWMGAALEDVFVADNLSIYLHPTRKAGKGPFGSDLAALDLISGDTIRPVIDIRGGRPRPPAPAYQQYLWGIPRGDLMDVILGRDMESLDLPEEEYSADQMLYLPYTTRTWTPYGFSMVEKCIVPVAIGMKRQEWLLDFFTEGSIPGVYIVPGPEVATPQQQRLLQDSLNALAGDIAYKHRVIVLPPGSKPEWQKDIKLAGDQTDQLIAEQIMMVCRIQPQEIAMLPGGKSNSIGAKGAAEEAAQATAATRTDPMRQWLKRSLFDYIIQRVWGRTQIEWKWPGFDNTEDAETQASIDKTYVSVGIRTVDEVRGDHGWEPYGDTEDDGMTGEPFVLTATGPVTLAHAAVMEQTEEDTAKNPPPPPPIIHVGPNGEPPAGEHTPPDHEPPTGGPKPPPEGEHMPEPAAMEGPSKPAAAPKPAPAQPAQTATKAAELADLRKFVKHGRDPRAFRPITLSGADVMAVAANVGRYGPAEAFRLARAQLLKAAPKKVRSDRKREHSIIPVIAKTAATLGVLASQLRRGKLDQSTFVDHAGQALQDSYGDAYDAGFGDADGDGTLDDTAYRATTTQAAAGKQREFLIGLAAAVAAGSVSEAALSSRLDMYAQSVYPVYEAGFGSGLSSTGQVTEIVWHAEGDADTCEPCDGRDGQSYTPDTLPGYPGELGICDGGPRCRCVLEYTFTPAQEQEAA